MRNLARTLSSPSIRLHSVERADVSEEEEEEEEEGVEEEEWRR